MRPTIQWIAVIIGGGTGLLAAALVATAVWLILSVADATTDPVTAAVTAGVLIGLLAAGYVTGRMTWRAVFHGALVGLLAAGAVTVLSLGAGSQAPPVVIGGFWLLALALGAAGGLVADRNKSRRRQKRPNLEP